MSALLWEGRSGGYRKGGIRTDVLRLRAKYGKSWRVKISLQMEKLAKSAGAMAGMTQRVQPARTLLKGREAAEREFEERRTVRARARECVRLGPLHSTRRGACIHIASYAPPCATERAGKLSAN